MRYYVGIDGGGTKSAICAICEDDFSALYMQIGSSSWREHSATGVAELLKCAAYKLLGDSRIAGMAMGLPCYGESIEGDRELELVVRKEFAGIPVYITNDVEVGWAGSLALHPGINIVAGTGSIAFGKDAYGKTARSGGWSEIFGDEGSCYWIGRKVLEMFSKQADGRIQKDALYNVVYDEFNLKNAYEIIDIAYEKFMQSREQVAGLQILAMKAALAGSACALALYNEAVSELCMLVDSIRNQLDFSGEPFIVSYTGGLYKTGKLVLPQFSREIEKRGGILRTPRLKAEEGAALLAYQHFCPESLETARETMLARS